MKTRIRVGNALAILALLLLAVVMGKNIHDRNNQIRSSFFQYLNNMYVSANSALFALEEDTETVRWSVDNLFIASVQADVCLNQMQMNHKDFRISTSGFAEFAGIISRDINSDRFEDAQEKLTSYRAVLEDLIVDLSNESEIEDPYQNTLRKNMSAKQLSGILENRMTEAMHVFALIDPDRS